MKASNAIWLPRQQSEYCDHAAEYLSLLFPTARARALAARLRKAKVEVHPAKNILRAARINALPANNAKVKRDLSKIAKGKGLPPILLVRGDAAHDLPLIVADGMHRLSAAWHHDEARCPSLTLRAFVVQNRPLDDFVACGDHSSPCCIVDRPKA
jgi:hypothetical protein